MSASDKRQNDIDKIIEHHSNVVLVYQQFYCLLDKVGRASKKIKRWIDKHRQWDPLCYMVRYWPVGEFLPQWFYFGEDLLRQVSENTKRKR